MGTDSIVGYNSVMNFAEQYLDRYLDPVTQAFTPAVAKSILELKPDGEVAAMGTLIALLKAKARRSLESPA
jgi:hypothetical protein